MAIGPLRGVGVARKNERIFSRRGRRVRARIENGAVAGQLRVPYSIADTTANRVGAILQAELQRDGQRVRGGPDYRVRRFAGRIELAAPRIALAGIKHLAGECAAASGGESEES